MHFIKALSYKEIYKIMTGRESNGALPRLEWRFLIEKLVARAPFLNRKEITGRKYADHCNYAVYIVPSHFATIQTPANETLKRRTAFVDLFVELDSRVFDPYSIVNLSTVGITDKDVLGMVDSAVTEYMASSNLFDVVIENAYIIDLGISDYSPETAEFLNPIIVGTTSQIAEVDRDAVMKGQDAVLNLGLRNAVGISAYALTYKGYSLSEAIEDKWVKYHPTTPGTVGDVVIKEKEFGIHDKLECREPYHPDYGEWCQHCRTCYCKIIANMCRTYVDIVRMSKFIQNDCKITDILC